MSAEKPWLDDFERQCAAFDELDRLEREGSLRLSNRRRDSSCSVVYSVRLDLDEVAALEKRAALVEARPTVLARNFIRLGLAGAPSAGGDRGQVLAAVRRLEDACAELRTLLS